MSNFVICFDGFTRYATNLKVLRLNVGKMFFHAEPHGTIPIDIVAYTHRESERESERERERERACNTYMQ